MNILHISDIHFRKVYEHGEDGEGYKEMLCCMQSPLIPLDYCFKKVLKKEKIDLLIISGDLTDDGEKTDYKFLKKYMKSISKGTKMIVTLGNHDNKANFRAGWLGEKELECPYNQVFDFEDLCVISFDSSLYNDPNGKIGKEQLAWLRKAFEEIGSKPVIIVTHHHLLKNQSSLPPADGSEDFMEVIRNKNVICILTGHTHHPYMGIASGKPYFTAASMSFCGEDEENGAVRFEEKYGYNLYQLDNGKIKEQIINTFITGKILKTIFIN